MSNRYSYTGREWDATVGLYHFRARWLSPKTGRFITRDPIGYEGSEWDLYEYCEGKVLYWLDPLGFKGDGHHIVPWSLFNGLVPAEVQALFDGAGGRLSDPCYKTHNGKILNGTSHPRYTELVRQALNDFMGGRPLSGMTPEEAIRFLDQINNMGPDTEIGRFLAGVRKEINDAIEKAAKEAAEKAAKEGTMKCCKKVGSCLAKKAGPICAFLFFCNDAAEGGVVHACEEAIWPLNHLPDLHHPNPFPPHPTPSMPKSRFPCFESSTMVHTPDGLKQIADIAVGDLVSGFDCSTMRSETTKVRRVLVHRGSFALNQLIVGDELVQVTDGHPIFDGKEWFLSHLACGQSCLLFRGSRSKVFLSTRTKLPVVDRVYNLETEDGTFVVGNVGLVVSGRVIE
ncbi:MAG: RHS repeat-associated core domain-containing protein [Pirellula sp.]